MCMYVCVCVVLCVCARVCVAQEPAANCVMYFINVFGLLNIVALTFFSGSFAESLILWGYFDIHMKRDRKGEREQRDREK